MEMGVVVASIHLIAKALLLTHHKLITIITISALILANKPIPHEHNDSDLLPAPQISLTSSAAPPQRTSHRLHSHEHIDLLAISCTWSPSAQSQCRCTRGRRRRRRSICPCPGSRYPLSSHCRTDCTG